MLGLNYTYLESLANRFGYKWFHGLYNLNIVGIRNKSTGSELFDDLLLVAYETKFDKCVDVFPCTLNPGKYWLKNLMDAGGAAILTEGQHLGCWKLGWFKGTKALLQIRPTTIYRDKNLDDKIDLDPKTITKGVYGLFMHEHFQIKETASEINLSSAGCIVPQRRNHMKSIIALCEKQKSILRDDVFSVSIYTDEQLK